MAKLKVGAAKALITPPESMMPAQHFTDMQLGSVTQDIFVRAVVIDNGEKTIVFLSYETGDVSRTDEIKAALNSACGIDPEYVFLSATHNHEAPTFSPEHEGVCHDPEKKRWVVTYGDYIIAQTVKAVQEAVANRRNAKWGYGKGQSYINVCRDQQYENGVWSQGRDFTLPSDKELYVIKFVDDEGRIIAGILNYAMHACACFMKKDKENKAFTIHGDIPGVTSEYLEERYQTDGAVFLWTSGAAGNQNPIYFGAYFKQNHDKTAFMAYNLEQAAFLLCQQSAETHAIDAIKILDRITQMRDELTVCVQDRFVMLPGQRLVRAPDAPKVPTIVAAVPFIGTIEDGPEVKATLKVLTLDELAVVGSNGELGCDIGLRWKKASPFENTMIVTHNSERAGYMPSKEDYDKRTVEFSQSVIKDGVSEGMLTPVLMEMLHKAKQSIGR